MSAHTPGPWLIHEKDTFPSIFVPANPVGVFVIADRVGGEIRADKNGRLLDFSEIHANARLIAAAPELLDDERKNLAMVENLIAVFQSRDALRISTCVEGLRTRRDSIRASIAKAENTK